MDGANFKAGAVAGVKTIKNPITAARMVMENSGYVLLTGTGAEQFATLNKLDIVDPSYFKTADRWQQIIDIKKREAANAIIHPSLKFGTVGAVAIDNLGHLAAGTSTGECLTKNLAGWAAHQSLAQALMQTISVQFRAQVMVSIFIRHTVAREVASLIEYKYLPVGIAAQTVLNNVLAAGGRGGLIAIDSFGNLAMPHTTQGMFWAYIKAKGEAVMNVCNMIIE